LSDARAVFLFGVDRKYVKVSPVPRGLLPKIRERKPARFEDEEVGVLEALPTPWGFALRFALASGARHGELFALRAGDVHEGVLTIEGTKDGELRYVPLPPEVVAEVRQHVGFILPRVTYWQSVVTIRRLSGIVAFRWHRTRHTFACRWMDAGGSLEALQKMLGHAEIGVTQRYAKLGDAAVQREAREVFARQRACGEGRGEGRVEAGVAVQA
jgi:integrase